MRIVAPWYSPVLPNGVVDELCAVEKALDSCPQTDSLHDPVASATSSFDLLRRALIHYALTLPEGFRVDACFRQLTAAGLIF